MWGAGPRVPASARTRLVERYLWRPSVSTRGLKDVWNEFERVGNSPWATQGAGSAGTQTHQVPLRRQRQYCLCSRRHGQPPVLPLHA